MIKAKSKLNVSKLNLTKQARMRAMLGAIICAAYSNAQALPTGEQVQAGDLSFVRDAQVLNINQASQQAIVNWQSFGIAANEAVRLAQPAQGSALFRVLGTDPTQVYGSLSATGSLFLVNPNGVLFAPGSQVNVGGLLATTSQISDQNFLNKNYQFNGDSTASVVNQGVIRTQDGGFIVLLANTVENAGTLIAEKGSVVLASAQTALLDMYGDGLVRVRLSGDALSAAISNAGNIIADGGVVQMAANARTAAVNVNGVVQANSLVNRNGVIRLESGAKGTTLVNGKVSAQGVATGTKGGSVEVTGNHVGLLAGTDVNVSGAAAGGSILVGGDYHGDNSAVQSASRTYVADGAQINADAIEAGDGGKVVVWADDITRYYGSISSKGGAKGGNGGFIEVSGKRLLNFLGKVDLGAAYGVGGSLLLDPNNIVLSTAPDTNTTGFTAGTDNTEAFADDVGVDSVFNVSAGGSFAGVGNGRLITLQASGNITIANDFNLTTATGNTNVSLGLVANNNLDVNANLTATGSGAITLAANRNITVVAGKTVKTASGDLNVLADYNNAFGGDLTLTGNISSTGGNILLQGENINGAGNVSGASTKNVEFTTKIGGTYSGLVSGTNTNFIKTGAGTLTLSGLNTYTGLTTVSAGTLVEGVNNALSSGALTVNGGTFDIGAFSDTVGTVTLTNGSITGTTGVLTGTSYAMQNGTVSAILGGAGALTKTTVGTVTLSGANTYAGATAVNAGTIIASNANALGVAGGGTTVTSGATLNINAVTLSESSINIAGTGVGGNGALTGTGAAGISGAVTTISGAKIATTSGASVLTLAGTVTAPGNLLISGAGDVLATSAANNFTTVNISGTKNVSLRDTNAITLGSGASSLTGNLTVQAGGNLTVANNVVSSGGDITLTGTNFINTAGATALTAGAGKRWLVYANTHTGNTFNGLNSGNQAIWNAAYPAGVAATGNRYVFANSPGTLTVTSTNQSKTYGQDGVPIVANAYNVTGTFVNAATFGNVFTQDTIANTVTGVATSTGSPVTANAGTYAIDLASITATTGYALTKNSTGNLTVNKAALTVTANAGQSKTYGNADPALTYTSNAVNGDTFAGTLARAAGENVGSYAINQGSLNVGTNYTLTYIANNLAITPRALTVTANAGQSKTYGNADPVFAYNVGGLGLANGDTLSGLLSRVAGETVGNYAINQGALAVSTNYQLTYAGNIFSILIPSATVGGGNNPRNSSGLVDVNQALGNYINSQLQVLSLGATAAGKDSTGNEVTCEAEPESKAKYKDTVLMLNSGLKLPKGVSASCDKT